MTGWRRWAALGVLALLLGAGAARDEPRVSLVVLLAIDQLRSEELELYDSLFHGGLRRLLDRGRYFPNAVHDHAHTRTAVGHATLSTGVHPARHGIVANEWSEPTADGWRRVYAVNDASSAPVSGSGRERSFGRWLRDGWNVVAGSSRHTLRDWAREGAAWIRGADEGRSPHLLLREGLADWIAAAHPEARVVSVSHKDRAAILIGGRSRAHVYWFDDDRGEFVTSTYYRQAAPEWLLRFHREALPALLADTVWTSTVPPSAAGLTRRDTFAYEGDGVNTYFPHRFAVEGGGRGRTEFHRWIAQTPALDDAVMGLARAAVQALEMGKGDRVDFLGLVLSQTDYIGHAYGPRSREQLDNLLRLDCELGEFFEFLDRVVGPDRYVVALSSDHGALPIPEYLQELGLPARRIHPDSLPVAVERVLGRPVAEADPAALVAALERLDFVARVIPARATGRCGADGFLRRARASLVSRRPRPGPIPPPRVRRPLH